MRCFGGRSLFGRCSPPILRWQDPTRHHSSRFSSFSSDSSGLGQPGGGSCSALPGTHSPNEPVHLCAPARKREGSCASCRSTLTYKAPRSVALTAYKTSCMMRLERDPQSEARGALRSSQHHGPSSRKPTRGSTCVRFGSRLARDRAGRPRRQRRERAPTRATIRRCPVQ